MKFTAALVAVVGMVEATRFKSGAVTGFEKFTYGKFITRMKAPNKMGTVSSFFTYWNGPNFYPGGWNELDVEIVPSVSQNPFSMNIIYGDGHNKQETHAYKESFDPKNDWHIYEMAWTPDYVAWSVDNKEVRRVKSSDPSIKYLNKGQSVMMNFWTPTFESWGKGFNAADMPWYVLYDYVETFTWNSETNGFDFHWRDDFTSFDCSRWHKSDNTTFDANSTTFRASQSYTDDGHLVLKMEPDVPKQLHAGQHHQPIEVEPAETMPTYQHKGTKEEGDRKGDAHLDVLAAQHESHIHHEQHAHHGQEEHRGYEHQDPYATGPYHMGRDPYERDPYSLRDYEMAADPYAAAAFRHYDEHLYDEGEDQEVAGAHLDERPDEHYAPYAHPHAPEHLAQRHEAPIHHEAPTAHDAQPIHTAKAGEAHVSTTPHYYEEMFGGQMRDSLPQHTEGYYQSPEHEYYETVQHVMAAQAHHPEVEVFGVRDNLSIHGAPEIGHLDQTPFEHATADFNARFLENDRLPHQEVSHDAHGIEEHQATEGDEAQRHDAHEVPSYQELLWAYQHGGLHHEGEYRHDIQHESEVVHHEDVGYELDGHHDERRYFDEELPLFQPHEADIEYVLDHGEQHPAPHHYEHDMYNSYLEFGDDTQEDTQLYNSHAMLEDAHHIGAPFWRGDHYDDHHKQDEDFRHDVEQHHYHAGDVYGHDVDYHGGTELMHDIEHSYDQLFHEIEGRTKHGVEHHDVTYKTLPLHRKEHEFATHQFTSHDFHPQIHSEERLDVHHDDHHHEDPHHYEAPHHEMVHREAPHHEAPHHEMVHREALHHYEAPHHEMVHHEAPHHEAYHEAPHHEMVHREVPHHEVAHHDEAPHHEVSHHEEEGPSMYGWNVHDDYYHERQPTHFEEFHDQLIHHERLRRHDPTDHTDQGEHHDLSHEGDIAHGDLHFEPLVKGEQHEQPEHQVAYPRDVRVTQEEPHRQATHEQVPRHEDRHVAPQHEAPQLIHAAPVHHEAPRHEEPRLEAPHFQAPHHEAPHQAAPKTAPKPTAPKTAPKPAAPKAATKPQVLKKVAPTPAAATSAQKKPQAAPVAKPTSMQAAPVGKKLMHEEEVHDFVRHVLSTSAFVQ